jgi:hypothetical protein
VLFQQTQWGGIDFCLGFCTNDLIFVFARFCSAFSSAFSSS